MNGKNENGLNSGDFNFYNGPVVNDNNTIGVEPGAVPEIVNTLPVQNAVQEQVPVVQEQVPVQNNVQEQVPVQNNMQEQIPAAQPPMPVQNNMQEQVPVAQAPMQVQNNVQEQVPIAQAPMQVQNNMQEQVPVAQTPMPVQNNNLDENEDILVYNNKGSKSFLIIMLLFLAGVGAYYGYGYLQGTEDEGTCVDNIKFNGFMSSDNNVYMSTDKIQYYFDSSFNVDFITKVYKIEGMNFKVCYEKMNESEVNEYVKDAAETRKVKSFEIKNINTGKKVEANDIDSLLKELGYHSYGKHTEKAKVIEIGSGGFGYSGEGAYISHELEIEFENGKVVEATYKIGSNQQDKSSQLVKGNSYTFEFEVEEDTFDVLKYTINDFN